MPRKNPDEVNNDGQTYDPNNETVNTSQGGKASVPKTIVYKGDTGISPIYDSDLYFKGNNFFTRLLRFINILEPGRTVISISKAFMWIMIGIMIYTLVYFPDNLTAVISASAGVVGTMLNYSWRRYVQYRNELAHLNVKDVGRSDDDYRGPADKRIEIDK